MIVPPPLRCPRRRTSATHSILSSLGNPGAAPMNNRPTPPASPNTIGWPHAPDPAGSARLPTIPGYDVFRKIGSGGMSVVYLATQAATGLPVALKVLRAVGLLEGDGAVRLA